MTTLLSRNENELNFDDFDCGQVTESLKQPLVWGVKPFWDCSFHHFIQWYWNPRDGFFLDSLQYETPKSSIAPHPVSKHASLSHNTRLVGGGVAPRAWWHIVAKLLQCLQFRAWEQPLSPAWGRLQFPAWEHLPVPCLGTFAVPAWDACQFPALPGNACQCACPAWACLQSLQLSGMLASTLPGIVCQCPGCLGTFCGSPCLGRFASSLPENVCQCPAWACLPWPVPARLGRLPAPCLGTPFAGTPSLAEL